MNKDTLVLLSGMAPKEPEQWALDEWLEEFEKEHKKPNSPLFSWRSIFQILKGSIPETAPRHEWENKKFKKQQEWTRNEWPMLWAKKRMQAAGVA